MPKQPVGKTALGAAVCRLIEQYQPEDQRLFSDPIVQDLVGGTVRVLMRLKFMRKFTIQQTDAVLQGLFGAQVCRTRYIDDVVQAALAKGIRQLVLLGAGYDTRPYRLTGAEGVHSYEVDLPWVQAEKKQNLQKHFGRLPTNITFIPIDFETQSLAEAFSQTDFDPGQPAVLVWEAVTQYLTEAAVHQTLTFVDGFTPGSVIVFTYVLKSIIEHRSDVPDAERLMAATAKESPFIFGLEPKEMAAFLQPYHLALVEDVGNADYQQRYLQPMGRELVVSEAERIVQAVVNHPE